MRQLHPYINAIRQRPLFRTMPLGDGYGALCLLTLLTAVIVGPMDGWTHARRTAHLGVGMIQTTVIHLITLPLVAGLFNGLVLHGFVRLCKGTGSLEATIKLTWLIGLLVVLVSAPIDMLFQWWLGRIPRGIDVGMMVASFYGMYSGIQGLHQMNRRQAGLAVALMVVVLFAVAVLVGIGLVALIGGR